MFGRKETDEKVAEFGVLRIDLLSNYENQGYITELLKISNEYFYEIFGVNHIITKAISSATERISALVQNGFSKLENNSNIIMPYDNYRIR